VKNCTMDGKKLLSARCIGWKIERSKKCILVKGYTSIVVTFDKLGGFRLRK
jgi:hypothetical protein